MAFLAKSDISRTLRNLIGFSDRSFCHNGTQIVNWRIPRTSVFFSRVEFLCRPHCIVEKSDRKVDEVTQYNSNSCRIPTRILVTCFVVICLFLNLMTRDNFLKKCSRSYFLKLQNQYFCNNQQRIRKVLFTNHRYIYQISIFLFSGFSSWPDIRWVCRVWALPLETATKSWVSCFYSCPYLCSSFPRWSLFLKKTKRKLHLIPCLMPIGGQWSQWPR